MKRLIIPTLLLGLTACAHVKPIVKYTCMGCQALISSGVCSLAAASAKCKPDETLVIDNWDDASRNGSPLKFSCQKEKK